MAEKKKIIVDVEVKTKGGQKNVDNLNNSLEKTNKETAKTKDNINSITGGKLGALTGIVTKVTGSFKTLRLAIISTGIGALAIAVLAVGKAFTSSEEGQNKFRIIMAKIGVVLGNLMDLLADFGEAIIGAFENPKKAWESFKESLSNGFNFIKSQIIDRFSGSWKILSSGVESGILKMRIAWNKFTGDSKEAEKLTLELEKVKEKAAEGAKQIIEANKAVANAYNNAKEAVKGFVEQNKEEIKAAERVAKAKNEADKVERALLVQRAKLENEIARLKLKSRQEDQFSAEERKAALLEAQELEEKLLAAETYALKLRRDAQILENTFSRSNKENLDAEAEAIAAVIRQEAARTNAQRQTQRELNRLNKEIESDNKAKNKVNEDEENKRLESILKINEEHLKKLQDLKAKSEEEKIELERERKLTELENLKATEEEKFAVEQYYNALREEARIAREEKEEEAKIKKAEEDKVAFEKELEIEKKKRESKQQTLNNIISIFGEESKLGKAALLAKQAIALQEFLIDLGAIKSTATRATAEASIEGAKSGSSVASGFAETLKLGFPAAIPALVGYTGAAVGIVAGVKSAIGGVKNVAGKFGGGGGGGGANISTPQAPAAQSPSFNVVGGSETSQLAQTVAAANDKPTQTYVVSSEVQNANELERKRVSSAGF